MTKNETSTKFHYAWVICLCGLWMFLCNQGLCSNILSIYLPFIEAGGISDSMGSAILTVRCAFSFAVIFLVERYYRRFSLRTGAMLATLSGGIAYLVYAVGGSAPVYFFAAALGGIAYGLGSIYPVSLLLTNWFHTNRGLAIGISSAGSGVANMAFSPLVSALVLRYSLRTTFLLQAAFMSASALLLFLLLRDKPAQKGLAPYGADAESEIEASEKEGPGELPKLVLWMLGLMMLLIGGSGQAYMGHLSVLAQSCGYGVKVGAALVSIQGTVLVCSKFLSGGLADRFGTKRCTSLLMAMFVLGCSCIQLMNGVSLFWCYAPVAMMGFSSSVYNVGPPLWTAELSNRASYPKLLRWLQIFYNLGGILFSSMPGIIAEFTGEYKTSFIIIALMMLISLLILRWSYRKVLGRKN